MNMVRFRIFIQFILSKPFHKVSAISPHMAFLSCSLFHPIPPSPILRISNPLTTPRRDVHRSVSPPPPTAHTKPLHTRPNLHVNTFSKLRAAPARNTAQAPLSRASTQGLHRLCCPPRPPCSTTSGRRCLRCFHWLLACSSRHRRCSPYPKKVLQTRHVVKY